MIKYLYRTHTGEPGADVVDLLADLSLYLAERPGSKCVIEMVPHHEAERLLSQEGSDEEVEGYYHGSDSNVFVIWIYEH